MATRKLTTIYHLEELDLKRETLRTLKAVNVSAQELVAAARNDVAWQTYLPSYSRKYEANQLTRYPGIGEARAKEIIAAVDKAGFILHESEQSRCVRRLLAATLGSSDVLLEHYEDLEDMAPEALEAVDRLIETLGEREAQVIRLGFGLKDGRCHTLEERAHDLGVTRERVRQWEAKALAKLRHPSRRPKLEVAICYSHEALSRRMAELWSNIGKLRLELDSLRAVSPYPDLVVEFAGKPIEELDLSVRSFNCLKRAGINTVDQLCGYSGNELLCIRNFGTRNIEEIREALQVMGLELKS